MKCIVRRGYYYSYKRQLPSGDVGEFVAGPGDTVDLPDGAELPHQLEPVHQEKNIKSKASKTKHPEPEPESAENDAPDESGD